MHIAIAGAGMVGQFYAERWIAAGHTVTFTHVRDHGRAEALVARLGPGTTWATSLATGPTTDANPKPDVAVLAARFETVARALTDLGDLEDVVVLDAVNPFNPERTGLVDLGGRTAADHIGDLLAQHGGARHVKALHSEGVERIRQANRPLALFVAGDDPYAVEVAASLIHDAGLDAVATGALATAAWSEPPGPLFGQGFSLAEAQRALEGLR